MAEKKLREQVRDIARLRHLSLRTEITYWNWIKRFILFHQKRHPREMGSAEITTFLTHLAVEGRVAASTQNQAFNALLFLYRQVLKLDMPDIKDTVRARQPRRLPVVLTRDEAEAIVSRLTHTNRLVIGTQYQIENSSSARLQVRKVDPVPASRWIEVQLCGRGQFESTSGKEGGPCPRLRA